LDKPRTRVEVSLARHDEDRLNVRPEMAVHHCHLELVLEIRNRAQSPDDSLGSAALDVVDQQARKAVGDHARAAGRFENHLYSFLRREEGRVLRGVVRDRDDHAIENLEAPLDDIEMAVGEWIERPWEHRHPLPSGALHYFSSMT